MGGWYCAINSPLCPRWGQKSRDRRSRDFCPHLEPRGELIVQYWPPMSFRYTSPCWKTLRGGYTDYTMFVRLSPAGRHWGEGILITPCLSVYPLLEDTDGRVYWLHHVCLSIPCWKTLRGGYTDYTMFVHLSPAGMSWWEGMLITPCLFIYPLLKDTDGRVYWLHHVCSSIPSWKTLRGRYTDYTMFVHLSPAGRSWWEGMMVTPCLFIYPLLKDTEGEGILITPCLFIYPLLEGVGGRVWWLHHVCSSIPCWKELVGRYADYTMFVHLFPAERSWCEGILITLCLFIYLPIDLELQFLVTFWNFILLQTGACVMGVLKFYFTLFMLQLFIFGLMIPSYILLDTKSVIVAN